MTPSVLTLSDLERSKSSSLGFQCPISRKGAELGPLLLLTINRKPYMANPMTSSLWTLSDPGSSKSRSLGVWVEGNLNRIDIFSTSRNITTLIWMSQRVVCWRRLFPLSTRSFLLLYTSVGAYIMVKQSFCEKLNVWSLQMQHLCEGKNRINSYQIWRRYYYITINTQSNWMTLSAASFYLTFWLSRYCMRYIEQSIDSKGKYKRPIGLGPLVVRFAMNDLKWPWHVQGQN